MLINVGLLFILVWALVDVAVIVVVVVLRLVVTVGARIELN